MTKIGYLLWKVEQHCTLNPSKGVVWCHDLQDEPEESITQNCLARRVIGTHCTKVQQDGELWPTDTLVLIFNGPKVPDTIIAGYPHLSVQPFVHIPMHCFKCHGYSHGLNCSGKSIWVLWKGRTLS